MGRLDKQPPIYRFTSTSKMSYVAVTAAIDSVTMVVMEWGRLEKQPPFFSMSDPSYVSSRQVIREV